MLGSFLTPNLRDYETENTMEGFVVNEFHIAKEKHLFIMTDNRLQLQIAFTTFYMRE